VAAEEPDQPLFFPIDAAESAIIRRGCDYWRGLKGDRRYPARALITLRGLHQLAKYAALIRVIDGGSDYEFRLVGDVPVAAVGWNFQGRCASEPAIAAVMRANYRLHLYEQVVRTGEPWLFKCSQVDHAGLKLPVLSETVYLPLGDNDDAVDHLLGFTVFASGNACGKP
jgi:hypothetical protein